MTEASAGPKGGKKGHKHGRNKLGCKAYALSNNATLHKATRIYTHLWRYPGADGSALTGLNRCVKAATQTAEAFSGVEIRRPKDRLAKQIAYHAKRAAKAQRQYDKAEAIGDEAARMKAGYYLNRYAA